MNPVIKVVLLYLHLNLAVVDIKDDLGDKSVTIRLDNGSAYRHSIETTGQQQFVAWFAEASQWFAQPRPKACKVADNFISQVNRSRQTSTPF